MKVIAPAGSVATETELKFEVLPADPADEKALFQPFRLNFADQSQPAAPVEIVLELPGKVQLGSHIELKSWTDAEFSEAAATRRGGERVGDVYLSLLDRRTISVATPHFSTFKFEMAGATLALDTGDMNENSEYSRSYDDDSENARRFKRGGMDYWLPAGFRRAAVDVGNFSPWEDAAVGFHGCTLEAAKAILKGGFKLPSQLKGVRAGHIPLGTSTFGIDNWSDAVFLTPSHKYTMAPHYGGLGTLKQVKGKDGVFINTKCVDESETMVFCILQCRIRPGGLTKTEDGKRAFPGTTGAYNDCDHRVSSDGMEYHVKNPEDIQPYGLLMRTMKVSEWRSFISDEQRL